MDLSEIAGCMLDGRVKGIPSGVAPFRLGQIAEKGWNVLREDLPLPLAVLKERALEHNGAWMREFLQRSGAVIAPHGKTTMSPQLFAQQIRDGAWAITVATAHQFEVARAFGVRRIVLANQLVGKQAIRQVLDALCRAPGLDFYCLVDSETNARQLAREVETAGLGRPLQLLLEGGFEGGRAGCRTIEAALDVARTVHSLAPHLALRGVEGFEGLSRGRSPGEDVQAASRFVDFLLEISKACEGENLFAPGAVVLSAGGSKFYDIVVERLGRSQLGRDSLIVTRSGCYLTHDSVLYRRAFEDIEERRPELEALGAGLIPALEVWAYVQSRPEAGKVILTMGKRDVSHDDLPVALQWFRPGSDSPEPMPAAHVVSGLNDQHCHMVVPQDSPLDVGDMVCFGISHPCLTFDKWHVLCVVDNYYNVVSAVQTFF